MRGRMGKKTGRDGTIFVPPLYDDFFQPGRDNQKGWDDFCPTSLSIELLKWFHSVPLLVEIFDKTTLSNLVFKFNTSF